ncbi:hypothetical protein [Paraburkholderia silvatlantica]|uniref:Uncharacterized protein n=1 Tax=Paraburkholderia silvatlantica TaxID=321895 RepID=A0ABR6FP25_9BURK|nr:hypothetical protein [Paraburkholderia silvatlantica]MBB2929181.1 hypothetical protein [Paraburkholderia silvatlantica]
MSLQDAAVPQPYCQLYVFVVNATHLHYYLQRFHAITHQNRFRLISRAQLVRRTCTFLPPAALASPPSVSVHARHLGAVRNSAPRFW